MFQLIDEEFDGVGRAHGREDPAQHEDFLHIAFRRDEVFLAGTRFGDIDRRISPLVGDLAIKNKLGVTGAFEFFKDHFVHFRAGLDQRCRDNRQ